MKRSVLGAAAVALLLAGCGSDAEPKAQPESEAPAATPALDEKFGTGGIAAVPLSATEADRLTTVTVAKGGEVYAAGFVTNAGDQQLAVSRIGKDGKLDAAFGTNGVATVNASVGKTAEAARSVVVQSDGKVVVAGSAEHDSAAAGDAARDTDIVAARFGKDGKLDTSFGTNGIARIDLGVGRASSPTQLTGDTAWGLSLLPDDELVLFGTRLAEGADRTDADFVLVGLTKTGALDPSFGTDGVTTIDLEKSGDSARTVKVVDDSIVATGYSRNAADVVAPVLIRTSLTGKLDASFGTGGVASHAILPGVTESYEVAMQGDSYVMAGYGRGAGEEEKVDMVVYRFTSTGEWDKTFGTDGLVRIDNAGEDDRGRDLTVLPDGRILVVGSGKLSADKMQPMVVMLDDDGAPVTDFGTNGRILSDFGGPADSWFGIELDENEEHAYLVGFKGFGSNGGNDDAVVGRLEL